ncbi:unnamed protein product [Rhizopus microsporus]
MEEDQAEPKKEENQQEEETMAPLLSAPASWQIPISALTQKASAPTASSNTSFTAPTAASNTVTDPPMKRAALRREKLEARIRESKYNIEAWNALINDIQQTGDLDAIRDVYERFLSVFPTSPKHWLAYLELELKYSNFNEVEALFTRCLKTVLSVDLWKFYLGYIRRINLRESGSAVTPEARSIIEKAYEYVLSNVGIDKEAGPIWADYIYFLKSTETSNTWEEQRKMDSMRRAYQKAVTIPLNNVEHLWKEYDQWENSLNRLTAKKFLGEKSSAYMTARTALREMRLLTEGINTNAVALPPQWTESEIHQLELWKKYIEWEKSDPLRLEDNAAVLERVAYAYQQAFLVLRFYPELWHDFASYYLEQDKSDKAAAIYKQAIEVMPSSLLLNFSFAELCESRKQIDEARQVYNDLVDRLEKEHEELKETAQKEISKLQQEAEEERTAMNLSDDIDGEVREQLRIREKNVKKKQSEVEAKMNEEVNVIARAGSLVWICYMRFARRTEGITSARALFSRARKSSNCTYHVYVANALMEYHNSKKADVAGKVFSLGQKTFGDNPDFVCQHLDFLIQMNDDNNTRALFERTLATMPLEKATPIWLKFLDYENKYGDFASVQNVEKRRLEAMGSNTSSIESFLIRHSYLDIRNIEEYELGGLKVHKPAVVEAPPATTVTDESPTAAIPLEALPVQPTIVNSDRTKEKRPLLEPVHPERYPRPDLSQWQNFKPAADGNRRVNNVPIPLPTIPSMAGTISDVSKKMDIPLQQQASPVQPPVNTPQQQQKQQAMPSWTPPVQQQRAPLPDAVNYFVSNLPPAHTFDGPVIQAGELVDLLRNIILPLPPQGAMASQRNLSQPPMRNAPMPPSRDTGRGNYGYARQRTGGGGKSRTGGNVGRAGGGGKKRRGRDDYDDDYQGQKGVGPNRPPEFDLFRQRQVKRHRDDPNY